MASTAKDMKIIATMVREEDLDELENLRRELTSRCDQARNDGRIYLMQQYIRLVAVVSPEIDRVQRRFKRESLAELRRTHKDLRRQQREAADEGKEATPET